MVYNERLSGLLPAITVDSRDKWLIMKDEVVCYLAIKDDSRDKWLIMKDEEVYYPTIMGDYSKVSNNERWSGYHLAKTIY